MPESTKPNYLSIAQKLALLAAFCVPSQSAAEPLLRPAGLAYGERFRLIFVTAGLIDATSSSISVYNNFVRSEAAAPGSVVANLNIGWSAIVSTPFGDARSNTATNPSPPGDTGVPIYLVDGQTRIADHYDDFWDGTIDARISLDQYLQRAHRLTWTGTDGSGRRLFDWTVGGRPALKGRPNFIINDDSWIAGSLVGNIEGLEALYAISNMLTAVPEPSTSLLVLAACVVFSVRRTKRS